MAAPPSAAVVLAPDPKDRKWPERLVGPLNIFMAAVKNALMNSLTVGDNFKGKFYTFSFTYLAATPPTNLTFAWPHLEPPNACFVVKAEKLDSTAFSAAVQVLWRYEPGRVIATSFLGGFTDTQRYRITVLALA